MIVSLFSALLFSMVHAGCPAIGVQNVSGKILSCHKVNAPVGWLLDFRTEGVKGPAMGMKLQAGEKFKIFVHPDQKLDCQKYTNHPNVCVNIQQWCPMVGKEPHGAGRTMYNVRHGKCQ